MKNSKNKEERNFAVQRFVRQCHAWGQIVFIEGVDDETFEAIVEQLPRMARELREGIKNVEGQKIPSPDH